MHFSYCTSNFPIDFTNATCMSFKPFSCPKQKLINFVLSICVSCWKSIYSKFTSNGYLRSLYWEEVFSFRRIPVNRFTDSQQPQQKYIILHLLLQEFWVNTYIFNGLLIKFWLVKKNFSRRLPYSKSQNKFAQMDILKSGLTFVHHKLK